MVVGMCLTKLPVERFGPMCDATLLSIAWVEGVRDVVLTRRLGDHTVRAYTFT